MMARLSSHEREPNAQILVVDDDELVRIVVIEAIKAMELTADGCADGIDALQRMRTSPYDLIVTDMKLPGLDGLSLIRELKLGKFDTDVIVMTGYGTIENAVECMKAGALEYLIKPFTVDQIQVAVRKALEYRELRRRARERELYMEMSYVDWLTGVNNRRYLDQALESEIEKARVQGTSLILFMVDIDDFKKYNDSHGHQKGDEALAQIGKVLKSVCRGYDIVARYGGEEFAMLFPRADKSKAMDMAGRILIEMRHTTFEGDRNLPSASLTVSIGVASYPEDGTTAEELLSRADEALYAAKKAGKNTAMISGDF